jgi:hypothetical protein
MDESFDYIQTSFVTSELGISRVLLVATAGPSPADDSCIAPFISTASRIQCKRYEPDVAYR